MERTLDRAKFLALMGEWGHASSAELVEAILEDMGWGDRQAFTKADVVAVLEAVTAHGQREIATDPTVAAGTTPEQRAHLQGMMDAVAQHALPLLRQEAEKDG